MPETRRIVLSFEKGANNVDPTSVLDEGEAAALSNFEWLPNGGITPRPGWKAAGSSPTQPTEKTGRGIEPSWYESGVRKLVVALADAAATSYHLRKTNVADPTAYTTQSLIETVAITNGYRNDPVRFAVGAGKLVSAQPGYPSGQLRKYDGTTAAAIATSNIAGRALLYYLSRFWTGGGPTDPTLLRYSEIGDPDSWNVGENYIPIAQDDGEPIEDLAVWDRVLLVGKHHSIHYVAGNTIDTFDVRPLETRFGVARGRALVPSAFGVFIVGVDGHVYLWDGGSIDRITKKYRLPVAPADGVGYVSSALVGEKFYVVYSTTPGTVYCYEPGSGRWREEAIATATLGVRDLVAFDDRYLLATMGSTSAARILSVREESGAWVAGSAYRDPGPDAGDTTVYTATTRQEWPKGAFGKATLRSLWVRYRQWSGGAGAGLVFTPIVDGTEVTAQAKTVAAKTDAGVYATRVDFHPGDTAALSGRNFGVKVGVTSANRTYAIEELFGDILVDKGER